MAFWNRNKNEEIIVHNHMNEPSAKQMLTELKETIRLETESREKNTASLVRSNKELIKALDNATREFKKSK